MQKNNGLTQPLTKLVISHSMNIILPTAHPTAQIMCHVSICQCMHPNKQTIFFLHKYQFTSSVHFDL